MSAELVDKVVAFVGGAFIGFLYSMYKKLSKKVNSLEKDLQEDIEQIRKDSGEIKYSISLLDVKLSEAKRIPIELVSPQFDSNSRFVTSALPVKRKAGRPPKTESKAPA